MSLIRHPCSTASFFRSLVLVFAVGLPGIGSMGTPCAQTAATEDSIFEPSRSAGAGRCPGLSLGRP